jgi:hypothetical protein
MWDFIMARQSTNLILAGKKLGVSVVVRGYYARMKIWGVLVKSDYPLKTLEVVELTDLSYVQVKSWLDAWFKFGYVNRTTLGQSLTGGKRFTYEVIKRTENPPAIDLKGNVKPLEHRQLIWSSIRDHKALTYYFTSNELQYSIEQSHGVLVNHEYVVSYLWDLYRAGYLVRKSLPNNDRKSRRKSWSNPERQTIYSLVYDTGVLSPSLCREGKVFDANLGVLVT